MRLEDIVGWRDRLPERVWSNVNTTGDCWVWCGARLKDGYGKLTIRENGVKRTVHTHRMAYLLIHGEIEDGLSILHSCDNPLCLRPNHLFLGTQMDNVKDMVAKGRDGFNGERCGNAKLTNTQAETIRARGILGERHTWLASEYGVTKTAIGRVVNMKTFRSI